MKVACVIAADQPIAPSAVHASFGQSEPSNRALRA
jgi:hypothetical protein